jgi:CelD/BcsL family acetyltransferase involved in cellulose biosynthesis
LPRSTPYQGWEWWFTYWEVFQETYERLDVVCAYDQAALVIVLPFVVEKAKEGRANAFLLDFDVSDKGDVLVMPGYEHRVESILLDWMRSAQIETLDLRCVPAWSPLIPLINRLRISQLVRVDPAEFWESPTSHSIALPATWEDYLMNCLGSKNRKNVRTALRDAERLALVFDHSDHPSKEEIVRMIDLHCTSRDTRGLPVSKFMDPLKRSYLETILGRMFAAGQARVFTLMDKGHLVAFNFVLRDREWYYGLVNGLDADYLAISPGVAMMAYVVRHAIENGYAGVDFGVGDPGYKRHWVNAQTPVVNVRLQYLGVIKGYFIFLRGKVRLRTRLRQVFSRLKGAGFSSEEQS